jgi:hypothetical protein
MSNTTIILLELIGIGVAIIMAILSWVVARLRKVGKKVDTLWQEFFGVEGDKGMRGDIEDNHESVRNMVERSREIQSEEHRRVENHFRQMKDYLRQVSMKLDKQDIEVPYPDDKMDDEFGD